ncbi:MAG TPA: ABC transporter ATP-binding protein [Anaerovoracaceae bacterium]|nr:ABC transporter ATP-binding protein [Anaerovoracaceae bacterium]
MENLLEIDDLYVEYKVGKSTAKALNGVTFSMRKGEAMGLVGESGAGKTTTALSILRLLPKHNSKIVSGDIAFEDTDILKASEKKMMNLRGESIAMIFQNPLTSLNPVFTVGEQIGMVLQNHKRMSRSEKKERCCQMLEVVGINRERLNDYPNQFSGGMRQRVGIASALACDPKLIIADEPTTALDVTIQAQILELIKKLIKEFGSSLLMITHNLGIVGELCDRVAVMYAGRIIECGTVREVFKNPLHPYTKGLFDSIPRLTEERQPLNVIPGTVVNAQDLLPGCPFHPRCKYKMDICTVKNPEQISAGGEHWVACYCFSER